MADDPKKLVTWKHWIILLPALLVGACLSLFREYRDTGGVRTGSIVISIVTFFFGLGIVAIVAWYANRPENPKKEDEK